MTQMRPRVVVTGMGCVSGLGIGMAETWRQLVAGETAIVAGDGTAPPIAPVDDAALAPVLAGRDLRHMGRLDRISQFTLAATIEAVAQAGIEGHPVLGRQTAVLIGCGSGGNATLDVAFKRLYADHTRMHPQTISSSMISAPASHVAMLLGTHGPAFVLASACASSAHAIGEAMHMIRAGRVKAAIAGGAEACLTPGSLAGWQSLGVLAPDTCRPFSAERKGMVLGEGAAVLVLEEADHAAARGATILGEVVGYGTSADAAHITAPDPDGIAAALQLAFDDAGIAPATPALIAAHGTGTALNDVAEAGALRAVMGSGLADSRVIATKSAHGHLIGGAGAIGFAIGMTALARGIAPPVLGHLAPDPACDLPLALSAERIGFDTLVANSFAFGGLNALLIGKRA